MKYLISHKISSNFVQMRILIGDSGSTKTDWAYISDGERKIFTTQGLKFCKICK